MMKANKIITLLLSCFFMTSCACAMVDDDDEHEYSSSSDTSSTDGDTTSSSNDTDSSTSGDSSSDSSSSSEVPPVIPPETSDLCLYALSNTLQATNFTLNSHIVWYPTEDAYLEPSEHDTMIYDTTIKNTGENVFATKNEYYYFDPDLVWSDDYYFTKENDTSKTYTSLDRNRGMFYEESDLFDSNKIHLVNGKYTLFSFKEFIVGDMTGDELLSNFSNFSLVDGYYVSNHDITYDTVLHILTNEYILRKVIKNLKIQIDSSYRVTKLECLLHAYATLNDPSIPQETLDYLMDETTEYYDVSLDFVNYDQAQIDAYAIYDGSLNDVVYNGFTLGIYFSGGEASLEIKGYNDYSVEELVIPETYQGYKITRLNSSIESQFWRKFTNLKSLYLTKYLTRSFDYYTVRYRSFHEDCIPTLEEIVVADDDQIYSSQDGIFYNKSKKVLLYCPKAKAGIVNLPASVESFNNYSFLNCSLITSIVLNNGVLSTPDISGMTSLVTYSKDNIKYLGTSDNHYYAAVGVVDKTVLSLNIDSNCKVLGNNAFANCNSLASINIPNGVLSIDYFALYNTRLTSLTIPHSVISINNYFMGFGIYELQYLEFGNGVKSFFETPEGAALPDITLSSLTTLKIGLGMENFGNLHTIRMPKLEEIIVDSGNEHYVVDDGILYNKAKTIAYLCPAKKEGSVTLPSSLITIGEAAFEYCENITSISLPTTLKTIGNYAFCWCGITSINLPNSLETIGDSAFYNSNLTSIVIPEAVKGIGESAFYCDSLTTIDIRTNLVELDVYSLYANSSLIQIILKEDNPFYVYDDGIIYNKSDLPGVSRSTVIFVPRNYSGPIVFDENVIAIGGQYTFRGCTQITSITFESPRFNFHYNIMELEKEWLPSLQAFNVSDDNQNHKSIDGILYDKEQTTLLYCPAGKVGVVNSIPATVKTIQQAAFELCASLTSINLPDGVETIGRDAFYGCTSLASFSLPNSIKSISNNAFTGINNSCFNTYKSLRYLGNSTNPYLYLYPIDSDSIEDISAFTEARIHPECKFFANDALEEAYYLSTLTFEGNSIIDTYFSEADDTYRRDFGTLISSILSVSNSYRIDNINIPSSNDTFSSNDGIVYNKAQITLVYYPQHRSTFSILNTVTTIGAYACYDNDYLTNISIPNHVTKIEYRAFEACWRLERVFIPDSVSIIECNAFYYCDNDLVIYCQATSKPDGWIENSGEDSWSWNTGVSNPIVWGAES